MGRANRNDPCPCGSGRKYKACCMERDRATERTLRLVGAAAPERGEEPWDAAVRAAEVWEADVVPLNVRFKDDPDASPALTYVGAATYLVHGDVLSTGPVGLPARARAVADTVLAAGRRIGVLPPRLHVRDEALADALRPELAPRGIEVAAAPMPELDEAIRSSLKHMAGDHAGAAATTPHCWAETEATAGELALFHAAAAAYFRAAPWELLDDDEPLQLVYHDGREMWGVVMGGAGMEFGLALYSHLEDYLDLFEEAADTHEHVRRMRGWALSATYEPAQQLEKATRREVAAGRWEVAGPDAYPVIFGIRIPGHRVTADHVRMMTHALTAVTAALCGADAVAGLPEAGVTVFGAPGEEQLWDPLVEAHPIGAEGPNADLHAAVDRDWSAFDYAEWVKPFKAEEARAGRFAAWVDTQPLSKAARRRHVRNARLWCGHVGGTARSAAAVTEYDLRSYVYDSYPRNEAVGREVAKALPHSLRVFFAWLDAEEGIGYPWAAAVLSEYERVREAREAAPKGMFWEEEVLEWCGDLWDDLENRVMTPDHDLPGTNDGWPAFMNGEVAQLQNELQRHWLIWYDEVVRAGTTDLDALREALVRRQRAWETAPHPCLDGRTPRDAVLALEANPVPPFPLLDLE